MSARIYWRLYRTEVQTLLHPTSLSYRLCSERIPPARPPWSSPASSPPQGRCVISCSSARTGSKHAACSSFLLTERRWQQGRKENIITSLPASYAFGGDKKTNCNALFLVPMHWGALGNRQVCTKGRTREEPRENRGLNYRILLPSFPTASPTHRPSFSQSSSLLV